MRKTMLTLATALPAVLAPVALAAPADALTPNPPAAHDDVLLVSWGGSAEIDLTANDAKHVAGYGQVALLTPMTPSTLPAGMSVVVGGHGYLAVSADRTVLSTEPLLWDYSIVDQFGESTATVTVVVTGVPEAPRARADRATVRVGERTLVAPLSNDTVPAGLATRPTLLTQRRTAGLRAHLVAGSQGHLIVVRATRLARPGVVVLPYSVVDFLGRQATGLIRIRVTHPHPEARR